jgi:hypothetical protein
MICVLLILLDLKKTQKLLFHRITNLSKILFYLASTRMQIKDAQNCIKLLTQLYKMLGRFFKDV